MEADDQASKFSFVTSPINSGKHPRRAVKILMRPSDGNTAEVRLIVLENALDCPQGSLSWWQTETTVYFLCLGGCAFHYYVPNTLKRCDVATIQLTGSTLTDTLL